ncbi:class I SAM-dependent methyltransferase [Anderseniella sp. Alg231-50]|uniref:class I SAM-dependent methyltransferase n=1 Tax=Anderseniella sp. Alg231-50 TaxID=1922226 RepID=UPI00307CC1B9
MLAGKIRSLFAGKQADSPSSPVFQEDWFSENEESFEQLLGDLAGQPCQLLEIGTHEGRCAVWLLENIATHPGARLDSIDVELQPSFWSNIQSTGARDKVTLHLDISARVLRKLPLWAFDFAYIDGSHWTIDVLEDAVLVFRLVKPGGIIAFDDYEWDDPEFNEHGVPKPAIDAFLNLYREKLEILTIGSQVWVKKLSD